MASCSSSKKLSVISMSEKLLDIPKAFTTTWTMVVCSARVQAPVELFSLVLRSLREVLRPILSEKQWKMREENPSFAEILEADSKLRMNETTITKISELTAVIELLFSPSKNQKKKLNGPAARELAVDLRATARAFGVKFLNDHAVKYLFDYISDCVRQWADASDFYAPYISLLNASMTGKSRTMAELCSQGVFVVTTCFRVESGDWYQPPRTPYIADWASKPYDDLPLFSAQACTYFEKCLDRLLGFLEEAEKDKSSLTGKERRVELATRWSQEAINSIWSEFSQAIDGEVVREEHHEDEEVARLSEEDKARQIMASRREDLISSGVAERIKEKLEGLCGQQLDATEVHVVFAFDEAMQIVKASGNFQALRRAMRILPDGGDSVNAFCVVTDTVSTITNFSPPNDKPFSARARDEGLHLFDPFVYVLCFDVWWREAVKTMVPAGATVQDRVSCLRSKLMESRRLILRDEIKRKKDQSAVISDINDQTLTPFGELLTMSTLSQIEVMSLFGRPAYYPFVALMVAPNKKDEKIRRALVELLKDKIMCIGKRSRETQPITSKHHMAVLGVIASIEVSAASSLATELSSGHMRPVAGVSEDRHLVYTLEVSEPVLSLAAHELILENVTPWADILKSFRATQLTSATMRGFVGETCAQFLILMAWQKLLKSRIQAPPKT